MSSLWPVQDCVDRCRPGGGHHAEGLTTGEISAHLAEAYGAEVSRQSISTITGKVIEGMVEWQNRPLDPVIFIDAIHVKIRDGQRPIDRSTSYSR